MQKRFNIILLILFLMVLWGCEEPSSQLDYQILKQTVSACVQNGEDHTVEPEIEVNIEKNLITIKNHQAIFRCCGEHVDLFYSIDNGDDDGDRKIVEIYQREITAGECDDCRCLRNVDIKLKLFDLGGYVIKIYRSARDEVFQKEFVLTSY